ncbi:MAG: biotin/lipoyl-binding carrier protein [Acidimicrobiia bacterium]|nr:biotin/lipoyl-binding carrier protein [Acidimicrobiia bacterium]
MVEIRAEIAATVWKVEVEVGQAVEKHHELVILESMKMEIPVIATASGKVAELHVAPDDRVNEGDLLVTLD